MVVTDFQSDLDEERLGRFLGLRKKGRMSAAVARRIDGLAARVDEMVDPQVNFRLVPVDRVKTGRVNLTDGTSFKSPKLAFTLKEARRVCSFIATIGTGLEDEVDRFMAQDHYADAYVLDVMASLAVEDVVEQFQRRMALRFAKKGRSVTLRFSPGYCDWPIQQQADIFKQFELTPDFGVTLSDAFLMTPRKSVSGVFGVLNHPSGSPFGNRNPCNHCSKTDCIARR